MAREPALSPPLARPDPLANPELGAKQICPTCSSKFYDLGRRPAHCPKCGAEFDPEEALRNRRVRPRAPLPEEEVEEVKPVGAKPGNAGCEPDPEEAPKRDEGPGANPWAAAADGAPAPAD